MEELFNIANEEFYFDIESISSYIRIEPTKSVEDLFTMSDDEDDEDDEDIKLSDISEHQVIDVTKWEIVKALIETVLNENGIMDESMGITKLESQLSIPFRLSFNTLIKNKLIKRNG